MASLTQRIERSLKTGSVRFLRLNERLKRLSGRRRHTIFVTAMPKSGSTFLVDLLAEATGFLKFQLFYDAFNEQDLYLPKLIDAHTMDVVCHQHTRATEPNLELMQRFDIKPVVLTRDLADIAVSMCDHLEREGRFAGLHQVSPRFADAPRSKRLDMVVDAALPWFVQFHAGWRAAETAGMEMLWLDYAELTKQPMAAAARVLSFHRIDKKSGPALASAVEAASARGGKNRFNKGVAGRGIEELTGAQMARLDALREAYDLAGR